MCGNASGWSKLALVILVIGLAIHTAGFATMYWALYTDSTNNVQINVGLWRMKTCTSGTCSEEFVTSQFETAAFTAVRVMASIATGLILLACILLIIYTCLDMTTRSVMATVIMILCYVAGACSFVAMVVNITTRPVNFDVSWSMGLVVIAMTLVLITGTLMIPDAFEEDRLDQVEDDYFGTGRRGDVSAATPYYRHGPPSRGVSPLVNGTFRKY